MVAFDVPKLKWSKRINKIPGSFIVSLVFFPYLTQKLRHLTANVYSLFNINIKAAKILIFERPYAPTSSKSIKCFRIFTTSYSQQLNCMQKLSPWTQDVIWTFYVRLIYVLFAGGWPLTLDIFLDWHQT